MIIIASASMIGSYIRHVAVEIFFSLFLFGSSPYFWVATSSTQHNCSKWNNILLSNTYPKNIIQFYCFQIYPNNIVYI